MFIKPAPGRSVYYERTRILLPVEGAEVPEPLSTHWHRRLNDKDILLVDRTDKPFAEGDDPKALPAPADSKEG
jgi:hypothetical protein